MYPPCAPLVHNKLLLLLPPLIVLALPALRTPSSSVTLSRARSPPIVTLVNKKSSPLPHQQIVCVRTVRLDSSRTLLANRFNANLSRLVHLIKLKPLLQLRHLIVFAHYALTEHLPLLVSAEAYRLARPDSKLQATQHQVLMSHARHARRVHQMTTLMAAPHALNVYQVHTLNLDRLEHAAPSSVPLERMMPIATQALHVFLVMVSPLSSLLLVKQAARLLQTALLDPNN